MKRLKGGILIAAGVLIAGASGLCTVTLGLPLMFGASSLEGVRVFGPTVLICGGIPMALGFGLVRWGRAIIRRADASGQDGPD